MDYKEVFEKLGYILSVPESCHPADTLSRKIGLMKDHTKDVISGLKQLQSNNEKLQKIADDLYFAYINKDGECPHQFEIEAVANYEALKDKGVVDGKKV